jgi:hypothetical protein
MICLAHIISISGGVVTALAAEGKPVAPLLGGTLDEVLQLAICD